MRFLVYWLLRKQTEAFCPGPSKCGQAPDDETPCADCPRPKLDAALSGVLGELLGRALDLEFALQKGITVTLDEIYADEFAALRVIGSERDRYIEERQQHGD